MAKAPLKECASCGKSWKKRNPEDATMCPFCGSTSVRDARMTDTATGSGGGCGGKVFALFVLIALGAGGYYGWQYWQSRTTTTNSPSTTEHEPATTLPEPPPPEPQPEMEPKPQISEVQEPAEPPTEESAPAEPAAPPEPPSRDWFELARNYHNAGRDDLARAQLQKIIEAGDPEWVAKAQAMLEELGAEATPE